MDKNKEFFEELDKVVQKGVKELVDLAHKSTVKLISFEFEAILDKEMLDKFGLNDSFRFIISTSPSNCNTSYLYKNLRLEPINYYLRPADYHPVSTLRILQECIAQDTNKPDIMYLERGEIAQPAQPTNN